MTKKSHEKRKKENSSVHNSPTISISMSIINKIEQNKTKRQKIKMCACTLEHDKEILAETG